MADDTREQTDDQKKQELPTGLYVFYDDNREVQIGVSGDYTIGEAVLILGAAKAKLELLQYHAYRSEQERQTSKSNIILPQ